MLNTWAVDGSIAGDNETKDGSWSLLSYALGGPNIDSTKPAEFSKSSNPTGSFRLYGENYVHGAKAQLKRGMMSADVTIKDFGTDREVDIDVTGFAKLENGNWTLEWTNPADTAVATKLVTITD